ncbi:MAG TPA: hypothetical protein VF542_13655, partial [Jatrophihabitans sp.]
MVLPSLPHALVPHQHPKKRHGTVLSAVLTSAALVVLGLLALPGQPAAAASDIGGVITTNEVMQRAADWYSLAPNYSQSSYSWDLGNTRQYRQDCSGFVDMALHLGTDYNTDGIAASSLFVDVGPASSSLTTADVRPGDVFDDTIDGHTFLFEGWAADSVHISYYNFGGGSSGTAPPEHHIGETFSQSYLGGEPTSRYRIYRYKNMVYNDASNSGALIGASDWYHIFVTTSTGAVAQRYGGGSSWAWDSIDGTILVGSPAVNYYPDTNEYD